MPGRRAGRDWSGAGSSSSAVYRPATQHCQHCPDRLQTGQNTTGHSGGYSSSLVVLVSDIGEVLVKLVLSVGVKYSQRGGAQLLGYTPPTRQRNRFSPIGAELEVKTNVAMAGGWFVWFGLVGG